MAQSGKRSSGGGSSRRSGSSARRSSSSRSGGSTRSSSTRKSASSRSGTTRKSTSSRSGTTRSKASQRRAASAGGRARGRQQTAQKRARQAGGAAARADFSGKSAAELRDAITRGLIRPLNLVMLTRDRIEEVVEDAVKRGRMTTDDAQDLVQGLISRGRKQTNDVLRDLEQLLGRGRNQIGGARKAARDAADPVLAQADRARRVAGVGPAFPILGYDDLTAAQVQGRLGSLSPAELRKLRDYEKRNANRKSVLDAINSKLGA